MLEIVHEPHASLREKAQEIPVADIGSEEIQTLIAQMKEVLDNEPYGVALAAPQVGRSLRLFIVAGQVFAARAGEEYDPDTHFKRVYVNPRITSTSKKHENKEEGCLSLRGKWGSVQRAERVTLEGYDEHGKKFSRGASGLLAQIFQHEIDHLEGVLYVDKAVKVWDDAGHDAAHT